MAKYQTDFLVIGGGVIGTSVARQLKKRYPEMAVSVLEKEADVGFHASGRNSGVLHAGFYYAPDSLKAKLTRDGNFAMREYCEQRQIPVNACGKLVVAKDASDLQGLDLLLQRGHTNDIELQEISAEEARRIEPRAKTFERALFSPTTASVDPVTVMNSMRKDAEAEGIQFHCGVAFKGRTDNGVQTSQGEFRAAYIINAAGLYADSVAREFGFSKRYRILPFKGLYIYSDEPVGAIRTNIYPVPDMRNPFLGVHFTVTSQGKIKIGPTAIPAFWREQYEGFSHFQGLEVLDILSRQARLLWSSEFDFKRLAWEEMQKYSKAHLVNLATTLVSDIDTKKYQRWGRPGIRAQLLDIETQRLEMDFVLEGDSKSVHILNAVSPAFTCALSFSNYVCDYIQKKLN